MAFNEVNVEEVANVDADAEADHRDTNAVEGLKAEHVCSTTEVVATAVVRTANENLIFLVE